MRILHTADWHFGRTLEGRSRQAEHEQFVDELCAIAIDEKADMVIIAGDIYDTVNPPAASEALYCEALKRLGDGGRRAVVVIAGNHDSPDRLCAVRGLAQEHGVTLLGYPADDPGLYLPGGDFVRGANLAGRVASGPGWAELAVPGVDHSAVVLALPYPSEARLKEALAETLAEEELQPLYSEQVSGWLAARTAHFRPDAVRLVTSHLFVAGGKESTESERPIQVGGAYTVDPSAFPESAQYVALGHLHRPQQMGGAHTLVRYSGSPLAFSFSETGYAKSVSLVEVAPAGPALLREIPLSCGRPLVRWKAAEGLAQVERWVSEGRDANAWVDLEIHLTQALTMDQIQSLRRMHAGLITIRPVFATVESEVAATSERQVRSLQEQFERFFAMKSGGGTPAPELVRLFLELAGESEQEGEVQP